MKQNNVHFKLYATIAFCTLFLASWFTLAGIGDVSASQVFASQVFASQSTDSSAAVVWPTLQINEIEGGLAQPVHVTHAGDGSGRLFVVEKGGIIKVLKNGNALSTPFLNISDKVAKCNECGLLSIAFPSDFSSKGYFFVYYNAKGNAVDLPSENPEPDPSDGNDSIIARFTVSSNPDVADAISEVPIMKVNQPYENHNGGQLAFGKDGHLYIGLGDGGSGGDPLGAGQRRDTLLGKILRVAVSESGTYTVPSDNPFVSDTSVPKKEIWSYGWRNPWRFSFDRQTGDMYIGDVGQGAFEEVDFEAVGAGGLNYGWNTMEGKSCYNAISCSQTGLTLPFFDYPRDKGRSVTGGVVYRGTLYPKMQGIYFWGDFASGQMWGAQRDNGNWVVQEFQDTDHGISSFGEDEAGNIYLTDYFNGKLFQLIESTPSPTATAPATTTPSSLNRKVFLPMVRK